MRGCRRRQCARFRGEQPRVCCRQSRGRRRSRAGAAEMQARTVQRQAHQLRCCLWGFEPAAKPLACVVTSESVRLRLCKWSPKQAHTVPTNTCRATTRARVACLTNSRSAPVRARSSWCTSRRLLRRSCAAAASGCRVCSLALLSQLLSYVGTWLLLCLLLQFPLYACGAATVLDSPSLKASWESEATAKLERCANPSLPCTPTVVLVPACWEERGRSQGPADSGAAAGAQ